MSCKPTTLAARNAYMMLQNNDIAFRRGIVEFDIILQQSNPAERYDRTTLLNLTTNVNKLKDTSALENYPTVSSRLDQRPMTYIEVADFLQQSGYQISDVANIVASIIIAPVNPVYNTYVSDFLNQLDFYFTENVASSVNGGTCGALSNPFSKVMELVNKIQNAMDLVKGLANFDFASLIGPLASIEQVLKKIVDKLKDTLLQQVNNIVGKISGIVANLKQMGMQVLSQFRGMVENVRAFLSDLSIEGIKKKIEQFIAKAVSQFEEITPEILSLLFFRFCQFSEMIQSFMQSPIKALQEHVSRFELTTKNLESRGLQVTQTVVASGGRRVRESDASQSRRRLIDRSNGSAGGTPTPAATPGLSIPQYVQDGTLSEQQANAILNMNDKGIPGYCTFGGGVLRGGGSVPQDGYRRVKDEVWVKLIKTLDMVPDLKPVTINSAYRSPAYNATRKGAAKGSLHQSGMAIDVAFPGGGTTENVARYIAAASIQGFGGIQTYPPNSFTHCDIGNKRTWSGHGADGAGGRWGRYLSAHLEGNHSFLSSVIRGS